MTDEPQRHRIQVACPECGHVQTEPALVISTQCRGCRTNFQVKDGKGVTRTQSVARLAKPGRDGNYEATTAPPPPKASPRYGPANAAPRSWFMRVLRPGKPPREVICFICGHEFKAIAEAQSSQCPKCGGYVNLLDHQITGHSNTRIETRGNVTILKTGSVSGVTIRCHHLTVLGGLSANVECSGDLVIRSDGKINGALQCRQLRVEKGARVEFLGDVTAKTASIDGEVRGRLNCSGPVTLEKGARLHGLVRCSELIVKSRAKHTGTIEIVTKSEI
jgi:cytoskeletal protein CcmA (bactofilin family)/predicted RNA-binding Zn-ribbon protein involved in translation (DUF1610 family)